MFEELFNEYMEKQEGLEAQMECDYDTWELEEYIEPQSKPGYIHWEDELPYRFLKAKDANA